MKFFSYTIVRDFGFAPNPFGGVCTLATCKPDVRKIAEVGDWVIGTTSVTGHGKKGYLVYAMMIQEKLTFNEYWNDPRFQFKKPIFNGSLKLCFGDNIYYQNAQNSIWHQQNSHHSLQGGLPNQINLKNDTSAPFVLISWNYYYFGGSYVKIPTNISDTVCHNKRVPRYKEIPNNVGCEFVDWLKENYAQPLINMPFHLNKEFKRYDGL